MEHCNKENLFGRMDEGYLSCNEIFCPDETLIGNLEQITTTGMFFQSIDLANFQAEFKFFYFIKINFMTKMNDENGGSR